MSPYSCSECEDRLRAATDCEQLLSWCGSKPVVGRVSGGLVRLRKRICYNNSFQTFFIGTLQECGGGTVLRGRAGIHPLVKVILAIWLGGFVVHEVGFTIAAARGQIVAKFPFPTEFLSLIMIVIAVFVVWFGRWLARNEEAFLLSFVAEVIAAVPGPAIQPPTAPDGGA